MRLTNALINRSCKTALLGTLIILTLSQTNISCKKVDEHADLVEGQPYIVTEFGLFGLLNVGNYQYQQKLIVGDTATLVGKLFLDHPDTRITLGNVPINIVLKAKTSSRNTYTRTGKIDSLDVCRFIVTRDMAGKNVPLTVSANGYTIQGPPVTVLLIDIGSHQTDTTLVVDKLGAWLPANASAFQNPNGNTPFINNCSVSGDGSIYFDNQNGLFRLTGGQVSPIVLTGGALTDQSQHAFTIDVILSSVISLDGNTLYFSSLDKEPVAPAADTLYIARLCSMDMQTSQVTTLNRTTVRKDLGTYTQDPSPYMGSIGAIRMVANFLSLDINGNLFFSNYYYPENIGQNPVYGGQYNSTSDWYLFLKSANNILADSYNGATGILGSICKLDKTGLVTSLAQTESNLAYGVTFYTTPGPILSDATNDFLSSPDGNLIYGWKYPARYVGQYDLNQYDQTQQDIEHYYMISGNNTYLFTSFDTAAETRSVTNDQFRAPGTANSGEFNNYLILANNDILYADQRSDGLNASSLYAYNMSTKTAYCYAGTENENVNLQTNETGNAKFVDFKGKSLHFCGLDRNGSVYYCIGGMVDYVAGQQVDNDYVNGAQFYKLHRKGI